MSVLAEVEYKGKTYTLIAGYDDDTYFLHIDKKDLMFHRIKMASYGASFLSLVLILILAWVFLPQWGIGFANFGNDATTASAGWAVFLIMCSITAVTGILFFLIVLSEDDFHHSISFVHALSKEKSLKDYCNSHSWDNGVEESGKTLINWSNLKSQQGSITTCISLFVKWFKSLSKEEQQEFLLESLEAHDANNTSKTLQKLLNKKGGNEFFRKDIQVKLRKTNEKLNEFDYQAKLNTAAIINYGMNQDMLKALAA